MMSLYLVDTHSHLWHPEYHFDLKNVLREAQDLGVKYFINIGVNPSTSREAIKIASRYRSVYASVGYHPHYAKDFSPEDKVKIKKMLKHKKVVALGEIGLDFYRNISNRKAQFMLLDEILKIWLGFRHLPLIIHNREADKEILSILDNIKIHKPKVIMHCFSGDRKFLEECLNRGYFISYATNLTFNNQLQEIIRYTPLDRLFLESDSPYLTPREREKRNKPSYLIDLTPLVAQIKNVEQDDVMRSLALNAKIVFKIGNITISPKTVYKYKGNLYINLTNRCSNRCVFCISRSNDYFAGYNLRLKKEPKVRGILKELAREKDYNEVTFCGFGEPFMRFEELKRIAQALKKKGYKIRVVSNGQANLILGRNILPEVKNLIDKISISLNVEDKIKYHKLCNSKFGEQTFNEVIDFVREAKKNIPWVEITFLNSPNLDFNRCQEIAQELGVCYRIRDYNIVI